MWRWFNRIYFPHVPTKTTLIRWAATIRPATLPALVHRAAPLAKHAQVTQVRRARKRRLDSTGVQTTKPHPTDGGVLGDGVRVLSRLLRQAKPLGQVSLATVREVFRSRLRTIRRLLQPIHHPIHRVRQALQELPAVGTSPAQPLCVASSGSSAADRRAYRLRTQFDRFLPLLEQAIQQAHQRVLDGHDVSATPCHGTRRLLAQRALPAKRQHWGQHWGQQGRRLSAARSTPDGARRGVSRGR